MKRLMILALLMSANLQAAGIKKWVDENGQIHYGDSPPAQVQSESIRVNRPPSNPGKPLPRFTGSEDPQQPAGGEPSGQNQPEAVPEVGQDEASKLCAEAKSDLQKLNRSANIRVRSADGSIRYLSAEEKEERRKQTEQDIEQFCK